MKGLFLLLTAAYFTLSPVSAQAGLFGLSCPQILNEVKAQTNESAFARQYLALSAKDSRQAWSTLLPLSARLNQIDNFSSPATQQLFLEKERRWKSDPHLLFPVEDESLSSSFVMSEEPNWLVPYFSENGYPLSEGEKAILKLIEKRILIAFSVVKATAEKNGLEATEEQGAEFISSVTATALHDLAEKKETLDFREFHLALGSPAFQNYLEHKIKPVRLHPPFYLNSNFVAAANGARTLSETYQLLSQYLTAKLEEMPVGISLRLGDLTSSVRFGKSHFFGSSDTNRFVDRTVYAREARYKGGMVDFNLEITNAKKKRIALSLDRTFTNLDSIFSEGIKCKIGFQTCGSWPSYFFVSHGVPIISFGYGVPSPALISLALQKALGLGPVKSISTTGLAQRGSYFDRGMFLFHDTVGVIVETTFYAALCHGASCLLHYVR